jgi:hypothetical protein
LKKLISAASTFALALSLLISPGSAIAATSNQTVTPATLSFTSWYFYDDTNNIPSTTEVPGKYQFVAGPSAAGVGSLRLQTTGLERWNLATSQYANTPLSSLSVKFNTMQPSTGQGLNCAMASAECAVYLNFDVDFGPGVCPPVTCASAGGYQRRLVYVPSVNGTVLQDTWQEWDATAPGALWTWSGYAARGNTWPDNNTSQYRTWADILAAFPNAHVNEDFGSSQLLFRAGEPYPLGFVGYLDKLTIGVGSDIVVYDLEPFAVVTSKDDCKDGGWMTMHRADGSTFKNQGDCVSYANNGK